MSWPVEPRAPPRSLLLGAVGLHAGSTEALCMETLPPNPGRPLDVGGHLRVRRDGAQDPGAGELPSYNQDLDLSALLPDLAELALQQVSFDRRSPPRVLDMASGGGGHCGCVLCRPIMSVCLGCSNKLPQTGGLINKGNFFLTLPRLGNPNEGIRSGVW